MGKINGKEGWISIGPWGGEGCIYSAYKSDGPIMQITIRYGDVIDSILFESKSRDDVVNGQSVKIGGTRGRLTAKFCIDDSVEQFSSISLTYKYYRGHTSISSLCLNTNLKKYGPFGSGGGHYVYIPIKGGIITGFFGHGGSLLDAIGIFMAPKVDNFSNSEKNVNSLDSIQDPDSAPTQLKGAENGWISLGPWGGKDGVEWAYKANEPIMKISICYGDAINSILFESKSCGDVLIGSSEKFGDTGGHTTKMFCNDSLVEQLSSISLTYDVNRGKGKIISLCFETNVGNKHGPYGSRRGAYSVSIPIQGGVIVGFHGRGETYLTAIGVFLAPKVNGLHSIIDHYYAESQLEGKIISEEGWISLGPWGGEGAEYSVFKLEGPIMQITIRYKWQGIKSILFENKSHNDVRRNYVKIGGNGGSALEKLRIDISEEQLTSISLTYKDYLRHPVISSLRFNTNLRTYGPYGSEEGHYVSIDSIPREGEVIAGFHGRGKTWLHAIGIFVAPKVNSFSNSKKNVNSLNSIQHPDSAPTQLKGNIGDEEGWVSYGPCGGNDGVNWVYKPHGPIMQITVCYGQVIDSILFESKSCDGVLIGSSQKIGGTGGHMIEMFCINSSEEQLSSISVTYNSFFGKVTIISLCFCTNINNYGPFGSRAGASSDSIVIPIEGGVVTGFHGRVRTHLTAIGVLVAPKVNSLPPIQDPNSAPTQFKLQLRRAQNMGIVMRDGPSNDNRVAKEKEKPEGKCNEKEMVTSMGREKENDIQVMLGSGVGSKLKTLENNIHSVASSSATTNKDDHHGGAPSPSSEMIRKDLDLVDSAFQKYIMYMDKQISETREKLKELQKLGSSERDFDELGKAIAKLKFQIPLTTNKHDHHGGALSPTSKMIRSDLILVDMAFAETKESMYHMNVKINQAHEKFEELELSPSSERDSDKLRKAKSDELRKAIAKLKVQSRSHNNMKTRSVDSNLHHKNWDNINGAEDEMTHFFHKEPEIAHTGDLNGVLKDFLDLPEPLRRCLSCFFKFPPMAAIKRTPMIYLWIGQGYISQYLHSEVYIWDVEVHADKIFDELIAKGFIEPIYKNCSLVPESCKMSLSVRSSLYEEAKLRGFTSNGTLDLDLGFVCGGLDGHSCLINVGEAIISCEPKIFENMKHIRSLYLGRWQSSATHHIELADAKIPHGINKLNSLTFLSLRGISMITELPTFISELNDLTILDLRACHNLEVIPDNIGLLKSLTHLDMSECYFLEHMPKSLAHLSNLQVFKGFLIGDFDNNKQSCTLLDLSGLRKLRKLNIYFSVTDLLRLQDLKNLERFEGLKKLTISWGGCSLQDRVEDTAIAFANATLPPRLQKLDLQCFPTTSLPDNWMMPSKHLELKKLYIKGGHLCDLHEIKGEQWTVEILQLKSLSKLNMDWRKLRILFPKLIYLHQVECPKFTNFPCDERGVWMDDMAINTNLQLQKYLKTSGMISSSSNWGSSSTSARDDSNICTADEK